MYIIAFDDSEDDDRFDPESEALPLALLRRHIHHLRTLGFLQPAATRSFKYFQPC